MMFLFGGIPEIYYNRFKDRARKFFPDDHFAGLPLYGSGRNYAVDRGYCEDLVKTLVTYVEGRPTCLDGGLGVVLTLREWERGRFETDFWPFAICKKAFVKERISRDGEGARRVANRYADIALQTATKLRKPVRALTHEFETRLRRTPLLLPLRHFDSQHLQDLMAETLENVEGSENPTDAIKAACNRFLTKHPFQTRDKGGIFESPAGVKFVTPPRENFHGRRSAKKAPEHTEVCFLNARTRLGGFFADGFHYDCSRDKAYSGNFRDCHGSEAYYVGDPHLNVYPNDFIR